MNIIILFVLILLFFIVIYKIYYKYIEYYSQILNYRKITDFTRWVLCDKYITKKYAEINGFSVPKTYQLVKYPKDIDFKKLPDSFVIKPTDLCDSVGVYLIKNDVNIRNGQKFDKSDKKQQFDLIKQLSFIKCDMDDEHYMHDLMYDGIIPYSGIIVEELLLDENGDIPYDYKCYTFGGKIYFIALTFNRRFENGTQKFDSIWVTRNWIPIPIPMIKKNYKYINIPKPDNLDIIIQLVEKMSTKLNRHCRIDIYNINKKIYLGEYTFFCGATLHSFICNFILGIIWLFNKDKYDDNDPELIKLIPEFYNKI